LVYLIDPKIIESFKELEVEEIPVYIESYHDKIAVRALDRVEKIIPNFDLSFQKQQVLNWENAQKMMGVAILGLSLSACSKEVTTSHVDAISPPQIGSPATEEIIYKSIDFANHGDEETEMATHFSVVGNKRFTIMDSIESSFSQNLQITSLNLYVNDTYVCSFKRQGSVFVPHETCQRKIDLVDGDKLKVYGIPHGQTFSILFEIESF